MFGEGEPHQSINFTATTFPSNKSIHVKTDMVFCPVRSQPGDALDNITMFLSVYIPTFLGPVITFLIFLVTFPCTNRISREEMSFCSFLLLPLLVIIHLSSYYIHLQLAEKLDLEELNFILVKYSAGFVYVIIVPILIIILNKELRSGVRKVLCFY